MVYFFFFFSFIICRTSISRNRIRVIRIWKIHSDPWYLPVFGSERFIRNRIRVIYRYSDPKNSFGSVLFTGIRIRKIPSDPCYLPVFGSERFIRIRVIYRYLDPTNSFGAVLFTGIRIRKIHSDPCYLPVFGSEKFIRIRICNTCSVLIIKFCLKNYR